MTRQFRGIEVGIKMTPDYVNIALNGGCAIMLFYIIMRLIHNKR